MKCHLRRKDENNLIMGNKKWSEMTPEQKEARLAYRKKWYDEHKEYYKEKYLTNKEELSRKNKEYYRKVIKPARELMNHLKMTQSRENLV